MNISRQAGIRNPDGTIGEMELGIKHYHNEEVVLIIKNLFCIFMFLISLFLNIYYLIIK